MLRMGLLLVGLCLASIPVLAHDEDASHDDWYMSLQRPDYPQFSCCGLADAYWCDDIHVKDGKTYCAITDDRPNVGVLSKRPYVRMGTIIEVPDAKLKWDKGNPTGHAVIFLSTGRDVYCFVQGGGI